MKGIATITVRGADGKIKEKRTERNIITTAHVEKLKQALALQKFTRGTPNTGAFMFQGIWAHSAPLANLCDMQPVVLCGSTNTRVSGVSSDYSTASLSQIDGGDIESTWTWTIDKSVSISALSLHSSSFINNTNDWGVPDYALSAVNDVQGFFKKEHGPGSQSVTFNQSVSSFNKTARRGGGIYALPLYTTNEFIRAYASTFFFVTGMVGICDNTGTIIRRFPTTQFEGLDGISQYTFKVMPTAAADWLFVIKSTTKVAVYKIPRSASDDTIPLVTTISGTGFGGESTLVILNCAIFNSTSQSKTMFVGQSDGTYTLQTGVQLINGVFEQSYFGMYLPITENNPTPTVSLVASSNLSDADISSSSISLKFWDFPHSTILNLSSPITGESGDTITITYTVSVELDVAPTPPTPPTSTFSTDSWETIAAASADGTASTNYNVGDEKTVTLTTGEEIVLQIWGFDHDDLADGSGKAGITLGMKGVLNTPYKLSSAGGSWSTCVMRTNTMPSILATLPSDLQAVIKTVTKQSNNGLSPSAIVETDDQLFLFSPIEIAGADSSYAADGEQYAIWQTFENNGAYVENRIKRTSSGTARDWWTRYISYDGSFRQAYYFSSSGYLHETSAISSTDYVCFGFCV